MTHHTAHRRRHFWRRFRGDRCGATAIEYGLLVGLIAIAALATIPSMGTWVDDVISATAEQLPS